MAQSRQSGSNPTLDIRYWTLLADILYPSTSSSHQECIKAHKVWLLPFLGRTPLAPIVESLLALSASPTLVEQQRIELYRNSRRVLMVLWPLAVNKIGIDALLECFGALLVVMSREDPGSQEDEDENILALGGMIISAFKSSLANASNKRKVRVFVLHMITLGQVDDRSDSCTRPLPILTSRTGSSPFHMLTQPRYHRHRKNLHLRKLSYYARSTRQGLTSFLTLTLSELNWLNPPRKPYPHSHPSSNYAP